MELGQKNARCESLRALLPYVEWDRFVTLAGSKSGLRVTLSYLVLVHTDHSLTLAPIIHSLPFTYHKDVINIGFNTFSFKYLLLYSYVQTALVKFSLNKN